MYHVLILVILLFSLVSKANIDLGEVVVRGQGCNSETTKVVTKEKSIHVEFNNFEVKAGKGNKTLDRKNCSVVIPIRVPEGYRISVQAPIVEGKVNLETESSALVSAETFLAGSQGPKSKQNLTGPLNTNFKTKKTNELKQWSNCGESVNLRLNIMAMAKVEAPTSQASVAIQNFPEEIKVEKCF